MASSADSPYQVWAASCFFDGGNKGVTRCTVLCGIVAWLNKHAGGLGTLPADHYKFSYENEVGAPP